MTPGIYKTSLLIVACFLTYFGTYLLLGKIPQKLQKSAYHLSRQYMSFGFLTLALSIFIFYATDMGSMPPKFRIALNISCYYIASKFISTSFIMLIGRKSLFRNLRNKKAILSAAVIFPFTTWATLMIPNEETLKIVQLVMATILFASIILDVVFFFRQYNQVTQQGEYYYAEGIGVHINWMIKSVYAMVGIGVLSAIVGFVSYSTPRWILFIYILYFIAVCMYIFGELLNFNSIYNDLAVKSSDIDHISESYIRKTTLTPEIEEQIEKRIEEWVATKEYCVNGVNIITTASHLSTNRLYLSTYINITYKCSFRQWVSRLRINEAKRMIIESPETTITAIAEDVGFVSLTSFTHAFKNIEGCSPKDWANANVL